jgi:hypothetical protein
VVVGAPAVTLEQVKTATDIAGTVITSLAVIIGAVWAYFKFVKGRTFRPRLEVELSGQWRDVDGRELLQARIRLKNIGASQVDLLQRGTGLRVSGLADEVQGQPAVVAVAWEAFRIFPILERHAWIEPGETVSDEMLLDLGVDKPVTTLFEARLVWRWSRGKKNVVVNARRVIPTGARIDGTEAQAEADPARDGAYADLENWRERITQLFGL